MRRLALAPPSLVLLSALLLSGCTGAAGEEAPRVGGPFGARPSVVFPDGGPPASFRADEPAAGHGPRLRRGDVAIVQYTAHVWDGAGNRLVGSTFTRGAPAAFPLGALLPGLDRALEGRAAGSRVVAVIPPGDGFGARPPDGVGRDETLLYVVDVLAVHPKGASAGGPAGSLAGVRVTGGARPVLTVPRGGPPARFAARVLSRGAGRPVAAGQLVVVQYETVVWGRRAVVGGTWPSGRPEAFRIGEGGVIRAWERALSGVPVGSRVLMVAPPAYGYGAAGDARLGVTGSDTLVVVADVLGAY
uniref:FKBP-type peptidyl-prolyl cis-trans isomerase n=1 Tax=Nonomuraea pusilla TaxID=46177 RepID=UPI0006E1EDA2|nr:FKBP-type peptidyl-prolyl cis-trans isomerase [Nonomuraea pusilla]